LSSRLEIRDCGALEREAGSLEEVELCLCWARADADRRVSILFGLFCCVYFLYCHPVFKPQAMEDTSRVETLGRI
jgi:hypothetical protein